MKRSMEIVILITDILISKFLKNKTETRVKLGVEVSDINRYHNTFIKYGTDTFRNSLSELSNINSLLYSFLPVPRNSQSSSLTQPTSN
jgi:hypothetical protein